MRILITGAAGFAGSHIAEEMIDKGHDVVSLDCLTYAGRLDRLDHLPRMRVKMIYHDFRYPLSYTLLREIGEVSHIIHNGAESHVMRSFDDPRTFVQSNILGTLNMLEVARRIQPDKFIYVSTDEVLGPAVEIPFKESDPLKPTNPYAATKASGEFLVNAYFRSFGLPTIISRTMNMYGERQHPEKCVPLMIKKMLNGEQIFVHGNRENFSSGYAWRSGSRHWLHARNQANALHFLLSRGVPGERYHIGGDCYTNLSIALKISEALNIQAKWDWSEPLGPIHDFSYSLDDSKIRAMGWKPPMDFETSLRNTVEWTAAHPEWLE